jgi:hypothetical protein
VGVVIMFVIGWVDAGQLFPSLDPLVWPVLPLVPALGVLVAAAPAILAPPVATPPRRRSSTTERAPDDHSARQPVGTA